MEATAVFPESSGKSSADLDPSISTGDLDLGITMATEESTEFALETKINEEYLNEEQCLETEQSVQALLDQEKGK